MNTALTLKNRFALYLDLVRWDRPQGWLLLWWPTLSALWLAAGGFPGWHLLLVFLAGTVLMRSAGCAVNDVADRDFDRHVKRTAQRPITRGAIGVREALGVGAVLALLAFVLVLTTNALTVAWSFPALAVAILYPFTKRWIAMPQAVLGVAFSFGIPMAYAAVQGRIPAPAWWQVAANLLWVLAYDTEYAMVDRDDDLLIGIRTSAITLGRWDVGAIAAFYAGALALWAALALDGHWARWFWAAWAIALAQAVYQVWLIRARRREDCFAAFRLNHWFGLTLTLGVALAMAGSAVG